MRSLFSKLVLASTVAAGAVLAVASASAETLNVPFNFTAAGKLCPAGNYTVQRASTATFVTMTNNETRQGFHWVVGPGAPLPTDRRIVLSFDNRGPIHALRTVQYGPLITKNLESNRAKRDREHVAHGE